MTAQHIAIIPDGNRRWAKRQGLSETAGHKASAKAERVESFIAACKDVEVRCLTIWAFSTENWSRSDAEKEELFSLLRTFFPDLSEVAKRHDARIRWLGRRDRVPEDICAALESLEQETSSNDRFLFQLGLDYGGRDEIVRSVNAAVRAGNEVDMDSFGELLDTAELPDPDIIVRTGGERRLSGLMPYQAAYAELFFTETFFPDFTADDLRSVVQEFNRRQRRFGGD